MTLWQWAGASSGLCMGGWSSAWFCQKLPILDSTSAWVSTTKTSALWEPDIHVPREVLLKDHQKRKVIIPRGSHQVLTHRHIKDTLQSTVTWPCLPTHNVHSARPDLCYKKLKTLCFGHWECGMTGGLDIFGVRFVAGVVEYKVSQRKHLHYLLWEFSVFTLSFWSFDFWVSTSSSTNPWNWRGTVTTRLPGNDSHQLLKDTEPPTVTTAV